MAKEKRTSGVKVTTAEDVLFSMTQTDVKYDVEITSADEILGSDCFNFDKGDCEEITLASDIITKLDDKHAWAIFLDKKLIQELVTAEGHVQYFLIGYENGVSARQNETHFSQKENCFYVKTQKQTPVYKNQHKQTCLTY